MTITPLTIKDIEAAKDLAADNSNAVAHFLYQFADEDHNGADANELKAMFDLANSNGGSTLDELEQIQSVALGAASLAIVCQQANSLEKPTCDAILADAAAAMAFLESNSPLLQDPIPPLTADDIYKATDLNPDLSNVIAYSLNLSARSKPAVTPTQAEATALFNAINTESDDHLSGSEQKEYIQIELDLMHRLGDMPADFVKTLKPDQQAELERVKTEAKISEQALMRIETLQDEHIKKHMPKTIKTTRI